MRKLLLALALLAAPTLAEAKCIKYDKLPKKEQEAVIKMFNAPFVGELASFKPTAKETIQEARGFCYETKARPMPKIYKKEYKEYIGN